MDKVTLTIDDKQVVTDKESNILVAALENGIYIPHLCYYSGLEPPGICRLCVVDVNGDIVFSCRSKVKEGMVVKTRSTVIDKIREVNFEIIVANNHMSCKACAATGFCELQKIMAFCKTDKKRVRRLRPPEKQFPIDESNPYFDYDANKCVLCEVCIGTCNKIQKALNFVGRGWKTKVEFHGDTSICEKCGDCVARCPVGALVPKGKAQLQKSA